MSPYVRGWLVYFGVLVVLVAGLQWAGVPFWLRNVFAFAMGWTIAKHLVALRGDGKP